MLLWPISCLFLAACHVVARSHSEWVQHDQVVVVHNSPLAESSSQRILLSEINSYDTLGEFDSSDDEYAEQDSDDEIDNDTESEDEAVAPTKKQQKLLHLPEEILTCGESPFTPEAIVAAMTAGLEIVQKQLPRWKNKPREQPHYYNNREGFDFPDCTDGRMFEFPILVDGSTHPGGRTGSRAPPGAHRIIFKAEEDGGTFCGLITHIGASSRGSFVACE